MSSSNSNRTMIITIAVVVVVITIFIGYFLTSSDPEPEMSEPAPAPEEIAPAPAPEPEPEPEPPPEPEMPPEPEEPEFVLPTLDNSDTLVRDGVVSLTRHEGINSWLAPNQLTRKFVAFVDNVSHGQVAKEPVRALAPEGPFLVKKIDDSTYVLDPASYDRYDRFTEVALSIDAKRAAEFYELMKPLFQNAYQELGYGERDFDGVVFEAIGRLLETPVIEDEIRLVRPVVMYRFEDEKLESLSPAQKQMIRMGPENTRLLKEKISEIARELRASLDR